MNGSFGTQRGARALELFPVVKLVKLGKPVSGSGRGHPVRFCRERAVGTGLDGADPTRPARPAVAIGLLVLATFSFLDARFHDFETD